MKKNILGIALVATIFSLHAMEEESPEAYLSPEGREVWRRNNEEIEKRMDALIAERNREETLRKPLDMETRNYYNDPYDWDKIFVILASPNFAGFDVSNYQGYNLSRSSLLLSAVGQRNINAAKTLLKEYRVNPNVGQIDQKSGMMYTPLMEACDKGNIAMIRLLLDYGADVNIRDRYGSCFFYAREFLNRTNNFNTYNQILDLLRSTTATNTY